MENSQDCYTPNSRLLFIHVSLAQRNGIGDTRNQALARHTHGFLLEMRTLMNHFSPPYHCAHNPFKYLYVSLNPFTCKPYFSSLNFQNVLRRACRVSYVFKWANAQHGNTIPFEWHLKTTAIMHKKTFQIFQDNPNVVRLFVLFQFGQTYTFTVLTHTRSRKRACVTENTPLDNFVSCTHHPCRSDSKYPETGRQWAPPDEGMEGAVPCLPWWW